MSDYFGWQAAKQHGREPPEIVPAGESLRPSHPIEVIEHDPDHTSTTIVERIRGAIRERLRRE